MLTMFSVFVTFSVGLGLQVSNSSAAATEVGRWGGGELGVSSAVTELILSAEFHFDNNGLFIIRSVLLVYLGNLIMVSTEFEESDLHVQM